MSKQVKLSLIIGSFVLIGIIIISVVLVSKKGKTSHNELEKALFETNHYKGGLAGDLLDSLGSLTAKFGTGGLI